jgi:hypothetical protein
MGLVHGRTFDDEVLAMYAALGGPITAQVTAAVQKARGKGQTATTRTKAPEPKKSKPKK